MYGGRMRTTVNLDPDVAAAVERMRHESRQGLSEALNELARRGLAAPVEPVRYEHRSAPIGLKVDVANVAEVLELLDEA